LCLWSNSSALPKTTGWRRIHRGSSSDIRKASSQLHKNQLNLWEEKSLKNSLDQNVTFLWLKLGCFLVCGICVAPHLHYPKLQDDDDYDNDRGSSKWH
jgi:hypothetical protein